MNWKYMQRGGTWSLRVFISPEQQRRNLADGRLLTKSGKPKREIVRALGGAKTREEADKVRDDVLSSVFFEVFGASYEKPRPEDYQIEPYTEVGTKDGEEFEYIVDTHPYLDWAADEIEEQEGLAAAQAFYRAAKAPMTLQQAPERYRKFREDRDPATMKTLDGFTRHQNEFINWLPPHLYEPAEVTRRMASDWIGHLKKEGYADATVNSRVTSLRVLWDWLQNDREVVTSNIWTKQSLRNVEPAEKRRGFEGGEFRLLLKSLGDCAEADLALSLLFTGVRVSEACQWKVKDVTWGDDGLPTGIRSAVLKTKKKEPPTSWVPLVAPEVVSVIQRRAFEKSPEERIFEEFPVGKNEAGANASKRLNRRISKVFPAGSGLTTHSLRYAHATAAENAGLNELEIDRMQSRAGTSLATNTYSSGPDAARKAELQELISRRILSDHFGD